MPKAKVISSTPRRIYAIGDIHGCLNELMVLCNYLKSTAGLGQDDLVVFIGDYIDRGPEGKKVIDYLLNFKKEFPETVFLKGNHEDMLLSFLGYPGRMGLAYLANGGVKNLSTYGILTPGRPEDMRKYFPDEHLEFLLGLEDYAVSDKNIFVHAGLSPILALEAQVEDDLFWIRDEFIMNIHRFEKVVIFGHTPYHDVMFHLPYKIGIDTGLVYDNMLTCIELNHKHILQVRRAASKVILSSFAEKLEQQEG